MKILAVETSSAAASIAVAEHGRLTEVRRFEAPRGRGAELFVALDEMRAAWRGIERLAIGIGPGSYNGLRTACALAGSFEMALAISVVAVPSCCLLDVTGGDYIAVGDARGGRLWCAELRARRLVGEISLLTPEEFRNAVRPPERAVYRVGEIRGCEDLPAAVPDAAVLALLAGNMPASDPDALEPLYLKPPHITLPRDRMP